MIYRFEQCLLSTERRELLCSGIRKPIEPQVLDLLILLVRNRTRYVSKDEIIYKIWDGRAISDATLHSRINAARAAIGDSGQSQRLIATLRSKGFRFVGPVAEGEEAKEHPSIPIGDRHRLEYGPGDLPGVLVIPFSTHGGDQEEFSQANALAEDMISALAQAHCTSVVSQRTSFAIRSKSASSRQLARKVRARYAVEGSLRRTGQAFRLSLHLIDASSDRVVLSKTCDGDIEDLQSGVLPKAARGIAARIQALEYLRARMQRPEKRDWWDRVILITSQINSRERSLIDSAEKALRRAIGEDPASAQALSLLSIISTLSVHQGWLPRSEQIPKALQFAQEALRNNPEEPWARLALGYANIWVHPDEAIPVLQDVIAFSPNSSFAHYLIALASAWGGHGDRALEHAEIARQSASFDLLSHGCEGTIDSVCATACFAAGQYRKGIDMARVAVSKAPRMPSAQRALLMNCALGGERQEAQATLHTVKELSPDLSLTWIKETTVWSRKENQEAYKSAFQVAGLRE